LTEIVIFSKIRPAALEELFTSAVIPNLHFIGSPSPGVCSRRIASRSSRPSMNWVNFSGKR
jgi:hypothetical protein